MIYYINLDSRTDRRASVEKQFRRMGIEDAVRVPAVNIIEVPKNLIDEGLSARNFWHVSAGDIACGLSHQRAWARLISSGASEAVILEDDAALADCLLPFLSGDVLARTGVDLSLRLGAF